MSETKIRPMWADLVLEAIETGDAEYEYVTVVGEDEMDRKSVTITKQDALDFLIDEANASLMSLLTSVE